MVKVRNTRTGVEANWSETTYNINKQGMERGTIHFELVTDSPNIPTPILIADFLAQKKKTVDVAVVETVEPLPIIEEVKPKKIVKNANTKSKNRKN